jgi:hypothetical protein
MNKCCVGDVEKNGLCCQKRNKQGGHEEVGTKADRKGAAYSIAENKKNCNQLYHYLFARA